MYQSGVRTFTAAAYTSRRIAADRQSQVASLTPSAWSTASHSRLTPPSNIELPVSRTLQASTVQRGGCVGTCCRICRNILTAAHACVISWPFLSADLTLLCCRVQPLPEDIASVLDFCNRHVAARGSRPPAASPSEPNAEGIWLKTHAQHCHFQALIKDTERM